MQNLSNYSNSQGVRAQSLASIEHLQAYVTQLTLYINENNHKYNKNMHTLKEFYESQIGDLHTERENLSADLSAYKNELIATKDILANKNKRIREIEQELDFAREDAQQSRQKLMIERRKIDQIYEQLSLARQNCNTEVENASRKLQQYENQISSLEIQSREKDSQIHLLQEKLKRTEEQLSERYSLPEKIADIQRQNQKLKLTGESSHRKLREVQAQYDYGQAELQKLRKENETLRIAKGKFTAEKALQIQKASQNQKQKAEGNKKRMETQINGYIYQINQREEAFKGLRSDLHTCQEELAKMRVQMHQREAQSLAASEQKDRYIAEFGQLKEQYEGVIHRLEDSLIDYQKKNWQLEQENKDLNDQLSALQELLHQLRAINSLQPARRQYRKLAQMEVIASRPLETKVESPSKQPSIINGGDGYDGDWQKLLKQIQNIKV